MDHEIVNSSPENENKNENEETKPNLQNYYTPLKLEHNSLKRKSDASTPGFNCSANLEKSRLENSSLDLQFLIENKKTRVTRKSSVQVVDSPRSSNLPLSPENNDTQNSEQNDQNYQNVNPNKVKSNLCQSKFETSLLKANNESSNHSSFPSFAPDVVSDFSKPIVEAEYFLKVNSWEDMLFFKHQDYQFEKKYEIEDKPVKSSVWGFGMINHDFLSVYARNNTCSVFYILDNFLSNPPSYWWTNLGRQTQKRQPPHHRQTNPQRPNPTLGPNQPKLQNPLRIHHRLPRPKSGRNKKRQGNAKVP